MLLKVPEFSNPAGPAEGLHSAVRSRVGGKCVLLVAFDYPPAPVVGAIRPAGLAKYLPRFGWTPLVVTTRIEGVDRSAPGFIETEYCDLLDKIRQWLHLDRNRSVHEQLGLPLTSVPRRELLHTRLLSAVKALITYPEQQKAWIPFAMKAIAEVGRMHQVHAIISTAPPFASHMVASRASRLLGCRWIADYRDLWNMDEMTSAEATGIAALVRSRTEQKVLRNADALVTVSSPWANRLHRRYPRKRIACISNGFDEAERAGAHCELTRTFTVTHTGQLYQGRRDPTELLEVVRELIAEGTLARDRIRIRFYGPIDHFLPPMVTQLQLQDVVEIRGPVPRTDALQLQRESQLLLLLPWWNPDSDGIIPAKVFEYLAAARPILAVGGACGALTQLLSETKAGVHALSKPDIKKALTGAYRQFRQSQKVRYEGDERAIRKYTHEQMAHKFATLLDSVTGARNRARV